jgi:hypothetical protein
MEPEMVAAHIEAAYDVLIKTIEKRSGKAGQATDLAWKFLEKFVQLPLTLPGMEEEQTKAFFANLFHADATPPDPDATAPPDEAAIRDAEERLADTSLGEAVALAGTLPVADAAAREAVRRTVERRLSRDNPEVQRVIAYGARFLEPNPREIKRFVNIFLFFVMIHTERTLGGLPTPGSLEAVAKLALLSTKWPALMGALAETENRDGRRVFELLEDPPHPPARKGETRASAQRRQLEQLLATTDVGDATTALLLSPELRAFMTSEPKVGEAARAYL